MNEDRRILSDFSDVQIAHKFVRRVTPNPNFKDAPLFDVEYVRNDTG